MGQIELFNLLLGIIIRYLKPYSCVQVFRIREENMKNRITNVK